MRRLSNWIGISAYFLGCTLLVGVCVVFLVLFSNVFASPTPSSSVEKPVAYTSTVAAAEFFEQLSYPARLISNQESIVRAENESHVVGVHVTLGQKVQAGAKLLSLKNLDPVYKYSVYHLMAPVSGVVSQLSVSVGTQLTQEQPVVTLTDPTQVKVLIEVPVRERSALKVGQKGKLSVGAVVEIPVTVRGISPEVQSLTGTSSAELTVDSSKLSFVQRGGLIPGVLGQVTFLTDLRKAVAIPEYALVYRGKDPMVRVLKGDRLAWMPVKLGTKRDGVVEITSGLSAGSTLVERTSRYVEDGESIDSKPSK